MRVHALWLLLFFASLQTAAGEGKASGAAPYPVGTFSGPLDFINYEQRGSGIDGVCGYGSTGEPYVLTLTIKRKSDGPRAFLITGERRIRARRASVRTKRKRLTAVFVLPSGYGITTRTAIKLRRISASSAEVVQRSVSYREDPANSCVFTYTGALTRG